jgi:hypothetical protein
LGLESQTVPDNPNEDDDVDWKALVDLLREGKTVEIPCAKERDYVRRTTQMVKRADRRGIAVDVHRGEGVLRFEPRPAAVGNDTARTAGEGPEFRGERQQERQERREALRAERKAGRSQDE